MPNIYDQSQKLSVQRCDVVNSAMSADADSNPSLSNAVTGSSRAAPQLTVEDIDTLDRLAPYWSTLSQHLGSPIQAWLWAKTCVETVCKRDKQHLFVLRGADNQPQAVAPFVKQGGRPFSPLQMLGVNQLFEPMDFLYADATALEPLLTDLKRRGVALVLNRIAADSPTVTALQKVYQNRAWVVTRPINFSPYIPINSDWIEPESQFNSRRRSDFRRRRKLANKQGDVTFEILSPTPEVVEPLLDEAFQVEAKSWKGQTGTALLMDPVRGEFFREYAIAASQAGILRLCFMRINGQAVAMQLSVEYAARYWLLKIGYDESFSKCSPGHLLLLHTLKYAAERNLSSYELLGDAAPWKQHWTDLGKPCVQLRVYPHNLQGVLAFASDALVFGWTRLQARLKRTT